MDLRKNITRMGLATLLVASAGLLMPTAALAQEEAAAEIDAGPNTGKISFTAGFDVATAYWFRGIAQENQGVIIQPWLDMSINLFESEEFFINSFSLTIGTWNSVHRNSPTSGWYEADFYFGGSFGLPAGFTFDATYINLYNPDGGGSFAEEVDLTLSFDDSKCWAGVGLEGLALNPYATVAIEHEGGSDAGGSLGTYLELGIEPSFVVIQSETMPVTVSIPVTLGFSLNDYYEIESTDVVTGDPYNNEDSFGYVDVGIVASIPLPIPAEYGSWSASAGVHFLFLGDSNEDIAGADFVDSFGVTGGDDFEIWGVFGVSMEY